MGFVDLFTKDENPTMANFNKRLAAMNEIGNVHVWKKSYYQNEGGYYLGEKEWVNLYNIVSSTSGIVYYDASDSISVSNGAITMNDPVEIKTGRGSSYSEETIRQDFSGKFIKYNRINLSGASFDDPISGIYYVPPGFGYQGPATTYPQKIEAQKVYTEIPQSTYVVAIDRHAYPDSGEYKGAEYEYIGPMAGSARTQVVSYVGMGTYNVDNPNSITAEFRIKFAVLLGFSDNDSTKKHYSSGEQSQLFMSGNELTTEYVQRQGFCNQSGSSSTYSYGKKSEDGKTFFWYTTSSNANQLNSRNYTYYILLVGY